MIHLGRRMLLATLVGSAVLIVGAGCGPRDHGSGSNEPAGFTVVAAECDGAVGVDIGGIPVVKDDQVLSVAVVRGKAAKTPKPDDILFANAYYLDGRKTLHVDIDLDGERTRDYQLVISDSSGAVNYAQSLDKPGHGGTPPGHAGTPPGHPGGGCAGRNRDQG